MTKRIFLVCLALVCLVLTGCGGKQGFAGSSRSPVESSEEQLAQPSQDTPVAVLSTSMGDILIVLFPQYAPMAVENFEGLAQQGYYNGNIFHRVVADFVIQTGDATQSGTGGASIWNNNAYPNELSDKLHHYSGTVALARAADGSCLLYTSTVSRANLPAPMMINSCSTANLFSSSAPVPLPLPVPAPAPDPAPAQMRPIFPAPPEDPVQDRPSDGLSARTKADVYKRQVLMRPAC